MPNIKQTIEKVFNFKKLPEGWKFGVGLPIREEVISQCEDFLLEVSKLGIDLSNAFPHADGTVELSFYNQNKTIGIFFNGSNQYEIEIEDNIHFEDYRVEGLDKCLAELRKFLKI